MNNARKPIDGRLNVVAESIRFYREKAKLSYEKFSDKLLLEENIDINKQSLYAIEREKRTVVDYELFHIAKCLGVSVTDLLEDYEKNVSTGT